MRYFDFLSSERNQTPVTMIQKTLQHPLDLQSGHFLSEAPCTFLRFLNPTLYTFLSFLPLQIICFFEKLF